MKNWLLLLPLVWLCSCGVQKRKYQDGFYFSGKHRVKDSGRPSLTASSETIQKTKGFTAIVPAEDLSASAGKAIGKEVKILPVANVLIQDPDTCDNLIFRDGKEIRSKVLEITDNEVKYYKCDLPDGPFFVSRKSDIFMIRYANGTKDVFTAPVQQAAAPPPPSYPTNARYANPEKVKTDAINSLILGITGLILYFGSIPAIVLGRRVLKEVKRNPHIYKDTGVEGMAKAGLILGIIKWSIVILAVLFSLSLLVI